MSDSFNTRTTIEVGNRSYDIYSLQRLAGQYNVISLPYSLKVLLENLLRNENGVDVTSRFCQLLSGMRAIHLKLRLDSHLPAY